MRKTIFIIGIIAVITALGISVTSFINPNESLEIEPQEPQSYNPNESLETDTQETQEPTTEIQEPQYYISCGCGCCEFDKPLEEIARVHCLYKSRGESIQNIITQDLQLSSDPDLCATVGCSFPEKAVYCD